METTRKSEKYNLVVFRKKVKRFGEQQDCFCHKRYFILAVDKDLKIMFMTDSLWLIILQNGNINHGK